MKDSKFWIWFIPLFAIACVGIYFMLEKNMQKTSVTVNSDAKNIKEEYAKNNNDYYAVNLSDNNVYKYISLNDLKELLNNKDGLVFVGDSKNNVVRKNIVVLDEVVSSTSVPQVYYIENSDDLKNIILEKDNTLNIVSGTLIAVKDGNIIKVYYPNYILDNKELLEGEKILLVDDYKGIVNKFVEACNENC